MAGLVGRAELLSCVFFLLSIHYYVKAVRSRTGKLIEPALKIATVKAGRILLILGERIELRMI